MSKIMAIASQKGGVSKTTTVLNLATALAQMGEKVLAVDIDPQGSLSICAGVENPDKLTHTTYSLLSSALNEDKLPEPRDYIMSCGKIDVIPCNITLSGYEINQRHEIGAEKALQTVLEPLKETYSVILLDTGPSLGILTINAFAASNSVIIPVTPQLLSAVGLRLLIRTIERVQKHINPIISIEGVLMTMCELRTNLYKDMSEIMDKTYSQTIRIFNTVIPHSTKVGEANLNRKSVLLYDENSRPSQAYKKFAQELMNNA